MAIESFYTVPVTVKKKGSTVDDYGQKVDASDIVVTGRLQEANNLTLEIAGREVSVDAIFYCPANSNIQEEDRLELPQNLGEPMEVLRVKNTRHKDGSIHHLKVECGRTQRGRAS